MPRGRKVSARNVVGNVLVTRRTELGLPRHSFRWRYRLEHIEGTAKIKRALRLLRLEGSEEFLDRTGLDLDELEQLAEGQLTPEEVLDRARERLPKAPDSGPKIDEQS